VRYWRETFGTGYINTKDQVKDVTSEQTSLIVSILSTGTFFGVLIAAPTADYLG
jgi:SP family sugar:H+ symporter-like MFS transporter